MDKYTVIDDFFKKNGLENISLKNLEKIKVFGQFIYFSTGTLSNKYILELSLQLALSWYKLDDNPDSEYVIEYKRALITQNSKDEYLNTLMKKIKKNLKKQNFEAFKKYLIEWFDFTQEYIVGELSINKDNYIYKRVKDIMIMPHVILLIEDMGYIITDYEEEFIFNFNKNIALLNDLYSYNREKNKCDELNFFRYNEYNEHNIKILKNQLYKYGLELNMKEIKYNPFKICFNGTSTYHSFSPRYNDETLF